MRPALIGVLRLTTILVLFGAAKVRGSEAGLWSYDGQYGPDKWYTLYPICGMQRQSPINIVVANSTFDDKLDPLKLSRDTSSNFVIDAFNNGFTENVLPLSPIIRVTGGKLNSTFRVAAVHFHWGPRDDIGSEHNINSKPYALEMHVVCYDEVKFDSLSAAAQTPKGLAVIARLFQVSNSDNPLLKPVIDVLRSNEEPFVHTNITGFDVTTLLPSTLDNYYRYEGSLTTPPCYETVTWTVLADIGTVSLKQLNGFRGLHEVHHENVPPEEELILFNWRPIQPLNQRSVYRSFLNPISTVAGGSAAATVSATTGVTCASFVAFCLLQRLLRFQRL